MHGFAVFLGKEFTEIFRTWRIYVVPGILLVIAVMSPILAEVTPALVTSALDAEGQGIVIEIPPATTVDAYLQFSNNAMQIALIAVIIATAGAIAQERRSGTAQLVLTKPVSRTAMVLAKVLSNWLLLLASIVVSALVTVGVTVLMFDAELLAEFAAWVGIWYVLASLVVAIVVLFSVVLKSQAGAAGAGIGVYFVMMIVSLWAPAREYTPAGLIGLGDRILTGKPDVVVLWPVVTGIVAALALVALAAAVFRRQEL